MRHIPRSSRIFIGVLIIAMLLTYIALHFSMYVAKFTLNNSPELPSAHETEAPQTEIVKVSTEDWESYEDDTYPIAFLHPENWTVKASLNRMGFYDIVLNPGAQFYDMHIYASNDSYYGLEGLKQTPIKIGGLDGFKYSENLFGIKVGENYYTFDGTLNSTQTAELITLLDTIKFESSLLQQ